MNGFKTAFASTGERGGIIGGRYRIVGRLGEGGMSTVFLAEDLKLPGKKWAVKRIRPLGVSGISAAHEAEVLLKLDHPYLPHVVDFFPPDEAGFSHLVMEYVDGITLQKLFEREGGRLPVRSVVRYGIQLCELLEYLHGLEEGPVVYRDIKPANIMIDAQDHVRLIDFGIARRPAPERSAADTVPLGTIGFAAPELLAHGRSDRRSDLYSLGAVFYYLLSGGRVYSAVRQPLALAGAGGRSLAELVSRLLDDRPERRPESAAEVRAALAACLEADRPAGTGGDRAAGNGFAAGRRLRIVVGGLYAGAGATFTAIAIAKRLAAAGIGCAVMEHPAARPDLFGLLDGERRAPAGYEYGRAGRPGEEWRDGLIEWIARRPGEEAATPAEHRLLRIEAPVALLDVGDGWLLDDVPAVLELADAVVVAADPNPVRWSLPSARRAAELLMRRKEAGCPVYFVANRAVPFDGYRQWLDSFPDKPAAIVPQLPYELSVRALWQGRLVHDDPVVRETLRDALDGWLKAAIGLQVQDAPKRHPAGKGWLGKIFASRP